MLIEQVILLSEIPTGWCADTIIYEKEELEKTGWGLTRLSFAAGQIIFRERMHIDGGCRDIVIAAFFIHLKSIMIFVVVIETTGGMS